MMAMSFVVGLLLGLGCGMAWWRLTNVRMAMKGYRRCPLCEGAGWVNDITHSHQRPHVHQEPPA